MLLAAVLMAAAGCGKKQEAEAQTEVTETTVLETTAPETTEPETKPQPKLETAVVQGDGVPEVLALLHRGDRVTVLRWMDETHAWVKAGAQEGTVEKQMLQMANQEPYTQWTGYAMYSAKHYKNYRLTGEGEAVKLNTKLNVLEELDSCYLVELEDGTTGYMPKAKVSHYKVSSGGGGESSGGGGGNSGGGSSGGGGQDGGDISLMVPGRLLFLAEEVVTGDATVKVDGAELVLDTLSMGTEIELIAQDGFAPSLEGYAAVYRGENAEIAYVPEQWLQKENAQAFEPWDGYAGYNCKLYDNIWLQGKEQKWLYGNFSLKVLWEADNVMLVQAGDDLGYVAAETVRTTRLPAAPSGGDSGSSGGGGGGGASSGGDWTPPML